MSASPPVNTEILFYLAVPAFWLFVVGLDLVCLWSLRCSRIEATARVLWVMWIVIVPLLGAISYFIVRPEPSDEALRMHAVSFNGSESQRLHRNENIQR